MYPERLPDGAPAAVAPFNFDLTIVSELEFVSDETYYVQVSARQYRSDILN